MLESAQKRAALGEVEARHLEIVKLEANIRVWIFDTHAINQISTVIYLTIYLANSTLLHIQELHDMFYDMALLVEEQVLWLIYPRLYYCMIDAQCHNTFHLLIIIWLLQGELIDLIEKNVEYAGIYVARGQKNITRAAVIHRGNTRVGACAHNYVYRFINRIHHLWMWRPIPFHSCRKSV